ARVTVAWTAPRRVRRVRKIRAQDRTSPGDSNRPRRARSRAPPPAVVAGRAAAATPAARPARHATYARAARVRLEPALSRLLAARPPRLVGRPRHRAGARPRRLAGAGAGGAPARPARARLPAGPVDSHGLPSTVHSAAVS